MTRTSARRRTNVLKARDLRFHRAGRTNAGCCGNTFTSSIPNSSVQSIASPLLTPSESANHPCFESDRDAPALLVSSMRLKRLACPGQRVPIPAKRYEKSLRTAETQSRRPSRRPIRLALAMAWDLFTTPSFRQMLCMRRRIVLSLHPSSLAIATTVVPEASSPSSCSSS